MKDEYGELLVCVELVAYTPLTTIFEIFGEPATTPFDGFGVHAA